MTPAETPTPGLRDPADLLPGQPCAECERLGPPLRPCRACGLGDPAPDDVETRVTETPTNTAADAVQAAHGAEGLEAVATWQEALPEDGMLTWGRGSGREACAPSVLAADLRARIQAERDREHYAMRAVTPDVESVDAAWLVRTLGFGTGADASDNLAGLRADLARRGDAVGVATLDRVLAQLALVRVAATGRDTRQGGWEEVLATEAEGERTPDAAQDAAGSALGGVEGSGHGMQRDKPAQGHSASGATVTGYSGGSGG